MLQDSSLRCIKCYAQWVLAEYEWPSSGPLPGAMAKSAAKRTVEQRSPATAHVLCQPSTPSSNPPKRQASLPHVPALPVFPDAASSSSSVAPNTLFALTAPTSSSPQMPAQPTLPVAASSSSSVAPPMGAFNIVPSDSPVPRAVVEPNPVLALNVECKRQGSAPMQVLDEVEVPGQRGFWRCTVTACGRAATAEAKGKKAASRAAAQKLLNSVGQ